jgi:hypothetical protein
MNLVWLLVGLLPWAPTPLGAFIRVFLACSLLSVELQVLTWWQLGTLRNLVPVNVALATASIAFHLWRGAPRWQWVRPTLRVVPLPAVVGLAVVVASLNVGLPLEAADAYQLDRVTQIERLGTLLYDAAAEPKVNIAGAFYELMVADLRQIAGIGPGLVRVHGLLGLLLYLLALAAVVPWLEPPSSPWARCLLLVVPTVFHQLVLLKNDLFLGTGAFVALAWVVLPRRGREPHWRGALGAAWLVGVIVGSKQVNAPLVASLGVGLWLTSSGRRPLAAAAYAGGGVVGGLCAGLLLAFAQNALVYGDIFATKPVSQMESLHTNPVDAAGSFLRVMLSLVDLGQLTPTLWPGRGGWGGTLGLPFVWALAVVLTEARHSTVCRRVLVCAFVHVAIFGALFPDADLSHRLLLGPGLLIVAVGAHVASMPGWARATLVPVVLLSAGQLIRSAVLYALRP